MIKIILENDAEPLTRTLDGVVVAVAFRDAESGIIVDIPMTLAAQRGLIAALEGKPLIEVAHRIPDPPSPFNNGTH